MRVFFAIYLLMALLGHANAQTVQRIDVIEAGIYTSRIDKTVDAPGAVTGRKKMESDIRLVQATTNIPARRGVEFGFRYRIVGTGKTVHLKMITHVPPPGMRDPDTGNVTLTDRFYSDHTVGVPQFSAYTFDNDWEIVPGTWIFEIWLDDQKLASQSFEIGKE